MSNLVFAIRHAQLVEAVEECCPPVTAPYLQAAYDRMKLPIKVSIEHSERLGIDRFHVRATDLSSFGDFDPVSAITPTADFATSFYFKLCAQLSPAATPSCGSSLKRAGTADVSPDASALSFESAASPAIPASDSADAQRIGPADDLPPRSSATSSGARL